LFIILFYGRFVFNKSLLPTLEFRQAVNRVKTGRDFRPETEFDLRLEKLIRKNPKVKAEFKMPI